ncbi:MAG: hypothetical protein AAF811_14400, partial [Pseudomonadota bacterium]
FFCGVAGALFAFTYLKSMEPVAFDIKLSFRILFMVILGGLGTSCGSRSRRRLRRGGLVGRRAVALSWRRRSNSVVLDGPRPRFPAASTSSLGAAAV